MSKLQSHKLFFILSFSYFLDLIGAPLHSD